MNQTDSDHETIPIKRIHQAYQNSLEARRKYVQVRPAGEAARQAVRHDLHTAVGDYYETLRSVVKSSGRGDEFWYGSEEHHLWTNEVRCVETKDGEVPVKQIPEGEITQELLEKSYVKTQYVGLEALENAWAEVRYEQRSFNDAVGSHQSRVDSADPLPVDMLFSAARLLDELAGELGFLADPGTVVENDPAPV